MQTGTAPSARGGEVEKGWGGLLSAGGVSAYVLLCYSLATMAQLLILGGQPSNAAEAFLLLRENRVLGLLRLDLPTVLALPLYYIVFLGLLAALRRVDVPTTTLGTVLALAGVTLTLATPTALPMLGLAGKYAAADGDMARQQMLAAGEAILASDIWHGTGAFVGAALLQCGAVLVSVVMLRGGVFSRATALLGLVTHSLDLAHIVAGAFVPTVGVVRMAVAGPLYPFWFWMIGRRLRQLAAAG